MSKFTKGLLFGSLVGGITTLLTMKKNGTENRRDLLLYLTDTTEDVARLTSGTQRLKQELQNFKATILPETNQTVSDIQTEITKFQQMNQPRMNRIKWHLKRLTDDLEKVNR